MYRSRYGGGQLPVSRPRTWFASSRRGRRLRRQRQHSGADVPVAQLVLERQLEHTVERAASLVTGSHSIKVGYQGALLIDQRKNFGNLEYSSTASTTRVPDQITLNINRFDIRQSVRSDAFYAQEQWTIGRMTLQGALRYDHAWSYFPEQQVGPVRFFPTAVTYPRTTGVEGYNDLWPRAVSRSTCSARARRRSRRTLDGIWRRRRTGGCSLRPIRQRACRRRRRGRGPTRTATTWPTATC